MAETGLYTYALARGLDDADLAGASGIGDAPLRCVGHLGLVAVVSDVDLEEFGEEGLQRNLEDMAWLESVAVAHDGVVRWVAELGPVAPLRLATVFVSEHGVRDRLTEWEASTHQVLDRLEGAREWSVKVYVDPSDATSASAAEAEPATKSGPGAGAAYLRRRRAATDSRERTLQQGAEAADDVHRELAAASSDSRRLAAQDRSLTGHTGEMVLNGAYLVADDRLDTFHQAVADLGTRHDVRVESSGPWAPYSFATLEES